MFDILWGDQFMAMAPSLAEHMMMKSFTTEASYGVQGMDLKSNLRML